MPLTFDGVLVNVDSVRLDVDAPWSEFLRVRAADAVGWYGPVSSATAAGACLIAGLVGNVDGHHHTATSRALLAESFHADLSAVGALDAALWDLDARLEGCDLAALLGASDSVREAPAYASLLPVDLRRDDAEQAVARYAGEGVYLAKFGIRADQVNPERLRGSWSGQAERGLTLVPRAAFDFCGLLDERAAAVVAGSALAERAAWLEDLMAPYDPAAYRRIATAAPDVTLGLGEYFDGSDSWLPPWLGELRPVPMTTLDVISCGGITRALDLVAHAALIGSTVHLHGRHLRIAAALAMARPEHVASVEVQLIWEVERARLHRHRIYATGESVGRMSVVGIGAEPPDV